MVAEVSDNPARRTSAPEQARFTPDLKGGVKGDQWSQAIVDAKLGAAVVTPNAIEIKPTPRADDIKPTPPPEGESYTHIGCLMLHGDEADKAFDQLKSQGTDALNKPTSPGAPGAKDATEQSTADKLVQDTLKFANENYAQSSDELASIQGAFQHMDKDQTQRVIDSANKKLAESGLRYAQTQDGAVWLGYKKDDGTFEASEYMRPPECKVS